MNISNCCDLPNSLLEKNWKTVSAATVVTTLTITTLVVGILALVNLIPSLQIAGGTLDYSLYGGISPRSRVDLSSRCLRKEG